MEKFNINKVYTDKQAITEMDYQYEKMKEVESSAARCNRFLNMLALYEHFPVLKKLWDYVETAYQYIKKFVRTAMNTVQQILGQIKGQYFYVMRFYNSNHEWVFDKIGSTTQDPYDRLQQNVDYYPDTYYGEIILLYDTEDITPSSVENVFRNYLIRKYGEKNWIRIDRFKCQLDIEDIEAKLPTCIQKLRAAEIY
jgi:hypothetical protein